MIRAVRELTAILCVGVLMPGTSALAATQTQLPDAPSAQTAAKIPADQLDSLVAPIALYPDPLLSQTLIASTYPLEVVQLQQWLAQHKDLKDKALVAAVEKQDWDPTIQGLAALPDVVKQLADNIKWTTDLGNAFLAQQNDVMDAVQRMRKKAQSNGNLKSSEQQKVETKTVESQQVIVIEQANPQVVYVPSYNPTVVYGAPIYPYPPIYYPPPGYYAAGMAISFGVGIAMGAAWGGGWCCGSSWGGNNNVYINHNNNFVNNSNRNNINGGNRNNINNGNRVNRRQQQLAAQPAAPRRSALRRQRHRQQVRRHRAWRLDAESAGECPAEPGAPAAQCRHSRRVEPWEQLERRYARRRQPWWRERRQHELQPRHRCQQRRQPAGSQHPKLHQQERIWGSRQRYERQPGPGQPVARLIQHGRVPRRRRLRGGGGGGRRR